MKKIMLWKRVDVIMQAAVILYALILIAISKDVYYILIVLPCQALSCILNRILLPKKNRVRTRIVTEMIFAIFLLLLLLLIINANSSNSNPTSIIVTTYVYWIVPFLDPPLSLWYFINSIKELHKIKANKHLAESAFIEK